MTGQPQLGSNAYFSLDAGDLVVSDPLGTPSDHVIEVGHPFRLSLTLKFDGILARFIACCCLCWEIHYCCDLVCCDGDGTDHHRPKLPCSPWFYGQEGVLLYDGDATTVDVPAGTLQPGTYRLSAVVKFHCRCKDAHCRVRGIGAFTDGPMIEIIP